MAREPKHHPDHHILLAIIFTALVFGVYGFYIGQASTLSTQYATDETKDYKASGVKASATPTAAATASPTTAPTVSASPATR